MVPLTCDAFLANALSLGIPATLAQLETSGTPLEVAGACDSLLREAYWKHKRIDLVAALAHFGIAFCQRHATQAADPDARISLLSTAKTLAYNLASFTWPGWDEPGITLTPELLAQGLQAARLNLQFAVDLHKPADRVRNAHWLLGAQLLAASHPGHLEEALVEFEQALPLPGSPPDDVTFQLARGYILLTRCLLCQPGAEAEWSLFLASWKVRTDEAARFVQHQLATAFRVFGPQVS